MIDWIVLPFIASAASAAPGLPELITGTFSNEEQVYFAADAGEAPPPWLSLKIVENGDVFTLHSIDAHGKETAEPQSLTLRKNGERATIGVGHCQRYFEKSDEGWIYSALQNRMACNQPFQIVKVAADGLTLRMADGKETILKRARPVECWAAIPKHEKKPDGSTDWHFARGLEMHDQGGRVTVGGNDTGAEEIILRMRAVHWPPPSRNRPSMVLYIHKPGNPNRAVSYSWADIDASRVGINLRWMQASCTIEGAARD